jgi:hypothetical protein
MMATGSRSQINKWALHFSIYTHPDKPLSESSLHICIYVHGIFSCVFCMDSVSHAVA